MDNIIQSYGNKISKVELRGCYADYCRKHKLKTSGDKRLKNVLTQDYGSWEERFQAEGKQIPYWDGISFNDKSMGSMDSMGFSTYTRNGNSQVGQNTLTKSTTHTESLIKEEEEVKDDLPYDPKHIVFQTCCVPNCIKIKCNFDGKGKPFCNDHWDKFAEK